MTLTKTIVTPAGCTRVNMTSNEEAAFIADQSSAAVAQSAQVLKIAAHRALERSDMTAIRCFKAGILFPQEWQDYVTALRAIVNGGAGPLPAQPEFLKGT